MICLHEDITFRKWHVTTFSSELLCFEGKKTESRTTWQAANNPGWRCGVCCVTLSKRFSASKPVLIQEEDLHKCTRRKQWTSNKSIICRNIFLIGKLGEIYITRIIYFNKDMYISNIGNRFYSELFGFKHN